MELLVMLTPLAKLCRPKQGAFHTNHRLATLHPSLVTMSRDALSTRQMIAIILESHSLIKRSSKSGVTRGSGGKGLTPPYAARSSTNDLRLRLSPASDG